LIEPLPEPISILRLKQLKENLRNSIIGLVLRIGAIGFKPAP